MPTPIGAGVRYLEDEIWELQGMFPDISKDDFWILNNGNIGVVLEWQTTGKYACPFRIVVLIEITRQYPFAPPNVYIMEPDPLPGRNALLNLLGLRLFEIHHMLDRSAQKICYIDPSYWKPEYTLYDVAKMVQTWIWSYCYWLKTGKWKDTWP